MIRTVIQHHRWKLSKATPRFQVQKNEYHVSEGSRFDNQENVIIVLWGISDNKQTYSLKQQYKTSCTLIKR